jgi:hypothetical protein
LEKEEGKTWEEEENARSNKQNGNMAKEKLNLLSKWNETTHEKKKPQININLIKYTKGIKDCSRIEIGMWPGQWNRSFEDNFNANNF